MPAGWASAENEKILRCAVVAGGNGQPLFQLCLAAVAFVADDRVFAAELIVALQARAGKGPMLGAMNRKRSRAVHELAVTAVIAAPKEANARERVLRPPD